MILGIDLGSSLFKGEIFDSNGKICRTGACTVPYLPQEGNRVEMPVAEIGNTFREAVLAAISSAGIKPVDLKAIAITSQAQTFTLHRADGTTRFPFISWRDTRSEEDNQAAVLLTDFSEHCSVAECLPCLTVAQMAFGRQTGAFSIQTGERLLFLPTWFVVELTGQAVVDTNLAAMSGLYSLKENNWWTEALALCGLKPEHLPRTAGIGSVAGVTTTSAAAFGLPIGIPVVLAGNDQTAGAFGAAIDRQEAILITLGTSQVIYAFRKKMPPPLPGIMRGPYPGGAFYQMAADAFGAGTLNWALKVLPGGDAPKAFDLLASMAPHDCHGVRFVADGPVGTGHWTGTHNPLADVADQARALLICLAERMASMLGSLDLVDTQVRVMVAGGGSRSTPWMDCLQTRLGRPLQRCSEADPARGAFRMARSCL